MIFPGVIAQQQLLSIGGGVLWNPLNMASVPQIYLDAQESTITDVSGFASAISNLGAMGSNGDFVQATAANRPAILPGELNGLRVIRFDGVNDRVIGDSADQKNLYRNTAAAWDFIVYKKRSTDASATTRVITYASVGTSTGIRFGAYAGLGTTGNANKPNLLGRRLDADTAAILSSATARSGSYVMALFSVNFSTRAAMICTDGGVPESVPNFTAAAGNTSNTASQQPLVIGAFADGSQPADVDMAVRITSNVIPSTDDIDKLFGWAAHKYGLTANLPSGHPYKTTPPYV